MPTFFFLLRWWPAPVCILRRRLRCGWTRDKAGCSMMITHHISSSTVRLMMLTNTSAILRALALVFCLSVPKSQVHVIGVRFVFPFMYLRYLLHVQYKCT
ncbi:hypothetical protein B0J17DRAFT_645329 [Rhizoctonia solani]|nr:hypothetical protein B0J17DRAFT_645329 [Rhizoctonia solani]